MDSVDNDKLEQLNTRISNLKVVIQVAEMEISEILLEIDKLTKPNKIGFKYNQSNNEQDKKRPNKRTPSNS